MPSGVKNIELILKSILYRSFRAISIGKFKRAFVQFQGQKKRRRKTGVAFVSKTCESCCVWHGDIRQQFSFIFYAVLHSHTV